MSKYTVVMEWQDYDSGGMRHEVVDAYSADDAVAKLLAGMGDVGEVLVFAGEPWDRTSEVKHLWEEKTRREEAERQAKAKAKAEAKERAKYEKLRAKYEK